MCASWTGRVRREERERGRKTHAHTNALSFFTLCRQHHDTSKDYLLSHLLLTFFLSPCQTGTHSSRPESLTRTHTHSRSYTHSNSRKTNARHHPDFCMRTRTCTPSSTHTRTNQTLLNVCFLEEEPARFSTCLSALKSARVAVVDEAKVRRGGGGCSGHEAQETASGNKACERKEGGTLPPCSRPIVKKAHTLSAFMLFCLQRRCANNMTDSSMLVVSYPKCKHCLE